MEQFNKLSAYVDGTLSIEGDSLLLKCDQNTQMSALVSLRSLLKGRSGDTKVYVDFKGKLMLSEGTVNIRVFPALIKTLYSKNMKVFYIDKELNQIPIEDYMETKVELNMNSIFDSAEINF